MSISLPTHSHTDRIADTAFAHGPPSGAKVLIACDTYPPDVNGAGYFTHRLAVGLADRGNQVHVVCPSDMVAAYTMTDSDMVTVHRLRSRPILLHPSMRFVMPRTANRGIARIVDDIEPDVIHSQSHFPVGRAAIQVGRAAGVPVVATNHFMPENLLHHVRVPRRIRAAVTRRAWADAARVFARADHVTTPTPLAAEEFQRNGFGGEIEPVSCGIDLSRFRPRTGDAAPLRKRFGLTERSTILYVGRLDVEKRIDELIRAVPLLRRRLDVQLVIAGTGPLADSLTATAADLGVTSYVKFLGFVPDDDLPDLYRAADAFGIAGIAELQSIVTLEAMASGLPVVAADAVALPHLVRDGGNGYLFTPGDVAGLAARFDAILSSPAETAAMGAFSRRMAAGHDERNSLARFETIYDRLRTGVGSPR